MGQARQTSALTAAGISVALSALIVAVGCSTSKELDRNMAQSIFNKTTLTTTNLEYDGLGVMQCLHNMGFIEYNIIFASVNVQITPKGQSVFKSIDGTSPQLGVYHVTVNLLHTLPIKAESISGISNPATDASGDTKSVDFLARIDFTPLAAYSGAQTCMDATNGQAFATNATFKRYDDGWRLQTFGLPTWHIPLLNS